MAETAEVQVVRIFRMEGDSKVKAFADISVGDFIIKGLKVLEGKNGLFVSLPQEKSKDGKWYNTVLPATKEAAHNLTEVVLSAYQQ